MVGWLLATAPCAFGQDNERETAIIDEAPVPLSEFETDFSVPESPGLALLGLDAAAATSPGDMKAFTADLLNGVGLDGRLKSGVAITTIPAEFFNYRETIGEYRKSSHALRRALWDRTRFSVGTSAVDGLENAVSVGVGVTFQLLDHHDARMNSSGQNRLTQADKAKLYRLIAAYSLNPTQQNADELYNELLQLTGAAYGLDDCFQLKTAFVSRDEESADGPSLSNGRWKQLYEKLDAKCKASWEKHVAATPNWLLSVGTSWQAETGKYDDLDPEGASVWTAYTHPIDLGFGDGFVSSVTAYSRYSEKQEITISEDTSREANVAVAAVSIDLLRKGYWQIGLQASYNINDFRDQAVEDQKFAQGTASLAYRLSDEVWLKGSYGGSGVKDEEFFRLSLVFSQKVNN